MLRLPVVGFLSAFAWVSLILPIVSYGQTKISSSVVTVYKTPT